MPGKPQGGAARQLALGLGDPSPLYRCADYCIAGSNKAAAAAVFDFPQSGEFALIICGPAGAGKSHLAQILADGTGAPRRGPDEIDAAMNDAGPLVVIDGADRIGDAKALFALVEDRRARGLKIALAGRGKPADWAKGFKDLATRLEAMPRARLDEPDEALMRAVIEQRFRDRQWRATRAVCAYAAPRLPRTFAAAAAFVDAAGAEAIARGGAINLATARIVINKLSETDCGH